jgi:hypothetical protein
MAAADAFRDCLMGGGTIEGCAAAALDTMNTCMTNCGQPPSCEDNCRAHAADVYQQCIMHGGDPLQCGIVAGQALQECLANCVPPP